MVWIWNWKGIWYPVNNKSDSVKPWVDIMLYINAYLGKSVCFAIKTCVDKGKKTPSKDESKKNENNCRYKAGKRICKCSCNFCFVKTDLFRYSSLSRVYFKQRKGLAGRKPVSSLRQWLVNPFGVAHLSLTDSEISRSQIYWHMSESETENLQPQLYWACPPAGTETQAQNLQNLIFLQPGLRVYICNFIIVCSLAYVEFISI